MNFQISQLIFIVVSMIFVNNFILAKFLGLCPFIGVSKSVKPALSMGAAVIFVMVSSSVITWGLYTFVLVPFGIEYLRTITFILVIAAFVQFIEMFTLKYFPPLYKALGIYLALITTNCAVLGVTVLNINDYSVRSGYTVSASFIYCLAQAFFAGVGFTLALLLMSAIRERLELSDIPEAFKGVPIAFVVASLMSLAFMGFAGFKF